jgi:ABC-type phosphate transport system substrate-binding protein
MMKRYANFLAVLTLILGLSTLLLPSVWAADDTVIVIVNSANPVESLSVGELKKLFLSDRSRWDTGKSVAPVIPGSGAAARTAFLKTVCGMNDADFKKYFVQAAFEGKDVTPPKEVSSAKDVKTVVAGSPGGIGIVPASEFSAGDSGVKAVKVDGAAAGDAGYKLKM